MGWDEWVSCTHTKVVFFSFSLPPPPTLVRVLLSLSLSLLDFKASLVPGPGRIWLGGRREEAPHTISRFIFLLLLLLNFLLMRLTRSVVPNSI